MHHTLLPLLIVCMTTAVGCQPAQIADLPTTENAEQPRPIEPTKSISLLGSTVESDTDRGRDEPQTNASGQTQGNSSQPKEDDAFPKVVSEDDASESDVSPSEATVSVPEPSAPDAQPRVTHEDLDATLWIQTSAEYYATCRQAYRIAEEQLTTAINVPTWSADLVQQAELAGSEPAKTDLPTAVILDIDETVLDNSPYQARRIHEDGGFTPESWEDWVREARAEPVPGVREFLRSAVDAGVEVFFVTNRENSVEHATRRNLEALGLVEPDAIDRILSKRERDEWTSDKATRRAHIAKRYRILLLIGDDLNDFISIGEEPTSQARRDLAAEHGDMWGVKWIQLPNPNYGGWERSIYDWEDAADDAVKLQRKYDALQDAKDQSILKPNVRG